MITYSELFLLLSLIVSIIALVIDITKKKEPPSLQTKRLFLYNHFLRTKPSIGLPYFIYIIT